MRYIFILLVFGVFTNCDNSSKQNLGFLNFKSTYNNFFDNIKCANDLTDFGLTKDSLREFFKEVFEEENIESLEIIFYAESGEVINLYRNAFITSKNRKKIKYSLNNSIVKSIEYDLSFNLDDFISQVSQNKNRPTNNKLLLIKSDKKNSSCQLFRNINTLQKNGDRLVW